jgi:hypothetical protein
MCIPALGLAQPLIQCATVGSLLMDNEAGALNLPLTSIRYLYQEYVGLHIHFLVLLHSKKLS